MRKFFGERRDHLARRRGGLWLPQVTHQKDQEARVATIAVLKRSELPERIVNAADRRHVPLFGKSVPPLIALVGAVGTCTRAQWGEPT